MPTTVTFARPPTTAKPKEMPVLEKVGIAAASIAAAAAIGGGIAGAVAGAQPTADPSPVEPTVITVDIPIEVPVHEPVGPISMRLYENGKVNTATVAATAPQGALISMAAFVFFGCVFLGVSGFMYVSRNRRSSDFTRVAANSGEAEDAEAGLE